MAEVCGRVLKIFINVACIDSKSHTCKRVKRDPRYLIAKGSRDPAIILLAYSSSPSSLSLILIIYPPSRAIFNDTLPLNDSPTATTSYSDPLFLNDPNPPLPPHDRPYPLPQNDLPFSTFPSIGPSFSYTSPLYSSAYSLFL